MALTEAVLNASVAGATGLDSGMFAAIHSDATSGSQTSNERIQITWGAPAGGSATASNVPMAFTGNAGAGATHLALWSAAAAGTFRGSAALVGDQTFNASGDYNVNTVTMAATDTTTD